MRALVIGLTVGTLLLLSSCGDDDETSDDSSTETTIGVDVDVPDIIGATVPDATTTLEDADLTLRVVRRDGEDLAATADYVPDRVNVAVETQDDGSEIVTEVVSVG